MVAIPSRRVAKGCTPAIRGQDARLRARAPDLSTRRRKPTHYFLRDPKANTSLARFVASNRTFTYVVRGRPSFSSEWPYSQSSGVFFASPDAIALEFVVANRLRRKKRSAFV